LAAVVLHEALDERGAEGDGLAGSGLAASEHVAAGERDRDRRRLNRERADCTLVGEGAADVVAETQVVEGHTVDVGCLDRLRLEPLEHDIVVGRERALFAGRVELRVAAFGARGTVRAVGAIVKAAAGRAVSAVGVVATRGTVVKVTTGSTLGSLV